MAALILLTTNMPFVTADDDIADPTCIDQSTSSSTSCPVSSREATEEEADIDRNGNGIVYEIKLELCRTTDSPCSIVFDDPLEPEVKG